MFDNVFWSCAFGNKHSRGLLYTTERDYFSVPWNSHSIFPSIYFRHAS